MGIDGLLQSSQPFFEFELDGTFALALDENTRMLGAVQRLLVDGQLLVELFAGTNAGELDLDVFVGTQSGKGDQVAR